LDLYSKLINEYKRALKDLYNKYKDQEKNIKRLEDIYDTVLKNPERRNRDYGGGFKRKRLGGNNIIQNFKDEIKEKLDTLNIKTNKIDKIKNDYKKFKATTVSNNTTENEEILKDFYDNQGDNIFERILYQYDKDKKTSIPEIARGKLYDAVTDNNLDPEIELEITLTDKIIFIVLIVIIRTISLQITNYFIDNDTLTTVAKTLTYYLIGYVLIFTLIFIIINIDIFRLRLIFNYMNMHINSSGILTHLIMSIIIGYIVYLLIINISPENKPSRLSKNQKLKLKMRLEILTIAIITLLIIFILVV